MASEERAAADLVVAQAKCLAPTLRTRAWLYPDGRTVPIASASVTAPWLEARMHGRYVVEFEAKF